MRVWQFLQLIIPRSGLWPCHLPDRTSKALSPARDHARKHVCTGQCSTAAYVSQYTVLGAGYWPVRPGEVCPAAAVQLPSRAAVRRLAWQRWSACEGMLHARAAVCGWLCRLPHTSRDCKNADGRERARSPATRRGGESARSDVCCPRGGRGSVARAPAASQKPR